MTLPGIQDSTRPPEDLGGFRPDPRSWCYVDLPGRDAEAVLSGGLLAELLDTGRPLRYDGPGPQPGVAGWFLEAKLERSYPYCPGGLAVVRFRFACLPPVDSVAVRDWPSGPASLLVASSAPFLVAGRHLELVGRAN